MNLDQETTTIEAVHNLLIDGLKKLYREDYFNIKIDVSERNICARLAMHLENTMREKGIFPNYYVDVEYNRQGKGELKQVYDEVAKVPIKMVSDLLIQSRGIARNLLAVEMKKYNNHQSVKSDHNRLKEMVMSENANNRDCIHGTLLGAFIKYSKDEVTIEYFSEDYPSYNGMSEHYRVETVQKSNAHILSEDDTEQAILCKD